MPRRKRTNPVLPYEVQMQIIRACLEYDLKPQAIFLPIWYLSPSTRTEIEALQRRITRAGVQLPGSQYELNPDPKGTEYERRAVRLACVAPQFFREVRRVVSMKLGTASAELQQCKQRLRQHSGLGCQCTNQEVRRYMHTYIMTLDTPFCEGAPAIHDAIGEARFVEKVLMCTFSKVERLRVLAMAKKPPYYVRHLVGGEL